MNLKNCNNDTITSVGVTLAILVISAFLASIITFCLTTDEVSNKQNAVDTVQTVTTTIELSTLPITTTIKEASQAAPEASLTVEALKDNYSVYLANVWATMGFLIIAIGWLITHKDARQFIEANCRVKQALVATVSASAVLHGFVLYDAHCESTILVESLTRNAGVDYFRIELQLFIGSALVNGVFFLCLWVLLVSLKPEKPGPAASANMAENTTDKSDSK